MSQKSPPISNAIHCVPDESQELELRDGTVKAGVQSGIDARSCSAVAAAVDDGQPTLRMNRGKMVNNLGFLLCTVFGEGKRLLAGNLTIFKSE